MYLKSSAFSDGERIPSQYTCEGDRFLSPSLSFGDFPEETKSLALVMEDPDVPKEIREDGLFVHWVLFNIPIEVTEFLEGEAKGTCGNNTRGEARYTGPCPPLEYEPSEHRYIFTLYALNTVLDLSEGVTKEELLAAMGGHGIDTATLKGLYRKSQ